MTDPIPRRAYQIAISSQKGGVAKTTTCLSLGASLAERNLRVLLIDLDPQAHLTRALAIDPDSLRRTVGDVLLNQMNLLEVSRESNYYNLDLVPANRGLILVEKLLTGCNNYEFKLKASLGALDGQYYDVILFDCPPSFGPLTTNALTSVDLVIIPVTCDYFAAQSLDSFLNLLGAVRRNTNPSLEHRVLVTLYDGRTRLSKLMLDKYRVKYKNILFQTVIPIDVKVRESPLFGRPITSYASRARSAHEYRALARELMTCLKMTI
jgi:chromosome partitioning protein